MYRLVQLLAALSYLGFGVWGVVLTVRALLEIAGLIAALAGLALFPLTLAVVPWVELQASGDPVALVVVYGGGLFSVVLHWLGNAMRRGADGDGGTDP